MSARITDEDVEDVPVPMAALTRARLVAFARAVGKHPRDAASELLAELLADDEFWNAARPLN